jgi:hypothetical protein
MENGEVLSVRFTWTDPSVFSAPHTYEFRYRRLPATYEPVSTWPCDPYDQTRAEFLGDPAPFRAEKAVAIGPVSSVGPPVPSVAPTKPESLRGVERLEGDWVRIDPNGSGDFGGLASTFTRASLTPQGAAAMQEAQRQQDVARGPAYIENNRHDPGQPYIVVSRPCAAGPFGGGALGINPDSGGIHFVVHKDEVIFAPERGGFRHIYMDGRTHPDLSRWTPTASGHSVGRVENGELVVDTIGITPGVVTAAGYRTVETRLTERFVVSPDGKHLTINYRWDDPAIYQKPHEYRYEFDRLPEGSYALEYWCDASDPAEQQSVTPPQQ